jgi:hypothetical protein
VAATEMQPGHRVYIGTKAAGSKRIIFGGRGNPSGRRVPVRAPRAGAGRAKCFVFRSAGAHSGPPQSCGPAQAAGLPADPALRKTGVPPGSADRQHAR